MFEFTNTRTFVADGMGHFYVRKRRVSAVKILFLRHVGNASEVVVRKYILSYAIRMFRD